MKYTNIAGLPAPLVSAIQYDDYDRVGHISATGLIEPVRMHQLKQRHDSEISVDAADCIWRLIGSIGHKILERADTTNHLSEERITAKVLGWTVSTKPDLLAPDMTLSEYKFTSCWAVKNEKIDWVRQMNVQDWIYRQNGFNAARLRIVAILRDWSKLQAHRDREYPQVGVVIREVPQWSVDEQKRYIEERVMLHQCAEEVPTDELPICSDEERWKKPDSWACIKVGNKKATRVFSTEHDANVYTTGWPKSINWKIEHRPGSYQRCLYYCDVREFCPEGRKLTSEPPEAA
jgi:hypothetical protein